MTPDSVDVLVAGGGSAGLAAAICAARTGARTLLVERHGSLGGMATASLVHSICGLYRLPEEQGEPGNCGAVLANRGFPAEFATRLASLNTQSGGGLPSDPCPVRMGRVDVLLTQPTLFARVADELCAAEPNLTLCLHAELLAVETAANPEGARSIHAVEWICRGIRSRAEAKVFVDATGDAALAWMAGAECEQAPTLQRPAFIFSMGGVDVSTLNGDGRLRVAQRVAAAVRAGVLPRGLLGAHLRPTGRRGELFITIDLDDPPCGPAFDPASPESLTAMECHGRELAHELTRFLTASGCAPGAAEIPEARDPKKSLGGVPGFEQAYIAGFPARVGIRESRRIAGELRIETEDILRGAVFPDAVALSTWPIEMREQPTGPRLRFPEEGRPCEVPLRALRSKSFGNLLAAGRCLSSSHEAQASLRVIGTCLATGEAAGFAAALQAAGAKVTASAIAAKREALAPPAKTNAANAASLPQ